jgi:phosphoglycerate dehydrogenase-like enzyme
MNQKDIVAVTSRSFSKNASLVKELNKLYSQVFLNETGKTLKDDELIDFLKIASKAIVGIEDMSANTLAQLPNLKVISKYGVGLNNVDLEFCKSSGIRLGFMPGVNKQSVAELSLTLMLIGLKKIHQNHIQILRGEWPQNKGFELSKKTVGILGFGNIGQALARILMGFDCKINFFDARKFNHNELNEICSNQSLQKDLITQMNLDNVLSKSDIITIHLPLTSDTQDIIDLSALEKLKPHSVIVNTARGGIVNESDLKTFLSTHPDVFAAFDVFKEEPVKEHSLFNLPNFFGTSHRSSLTYEGINSMGLAAIKGLDDNIEIK